MFDQGLGSKTASIAEADAVKPGLDVSKYPYALGWPPPQDPYSRQNLIKYKALYEAASCTYLCQPNPH